MSKHTAREWYYTDDKPGTVCADSEGCPIVAVVGRYHVYTKNATRTHDKGDARLIAAAPELLAALRDLLAEFDSYDAAMAEIGRGHEDYGQQRAAARAAIAKAEAE